MCKTLLAVETDDSNDNSVGAIVGGIVGAIVGIIITVVFFTIVICCLYFYKSKSNYVS